MIYASLGAFDKAEDAASFLDKKPLQGFPMFGIFAHALMTGGVTFRLLA